ncbi:MAG: hypothetical protein E4H07_08110 [Nitrosomonadales bacterium]|jgi:hypothetical protein|nr:MAG: hypothetical protein E4H07_08110 [Nitrosomonadales bacterium]
MDVYLNQISGYFTEVPMWPLVLLAAAITCAGIYELYIRKLRSIAAKRFRLSIHSILSGLYPEPVNWPKDIGAYLRDRLPAMQEAVEDFKYDVPQERIPDYNKDWFGYRQFCDEITDDKCIAADQNPSEVSSKKVFHTLVSNLLNHGN